MSRKYVCIGDIMDLHELTNCSQINPAHIGLQTANCGVLTPNPCIDAGWGDSYTASNLRKLMRRSPPYIMLKPGGLIDEI
jgi:hypothetical protein